MLADTAGSMGQTRHFDRGRRLLIGLAAAVLLVACSRDLGGNGQTGTGAGQGGSSRGGFAGTAAGGNSGSGGAGGTAMSAACPAGTPTFSVCVVSSADMMPFPMTVSDSVTAAAATVEAVGTGSAPAQCQSARVFGAATTSDRWFQVRTADKVLWTVGLAGLGNAPMIQVGDAVTLDLVYARPMYASQVTGLEAVGHVQVSATSGTPLLWAGANNYYSAAWLSLMTGQALCRDTTTNAGCPSTRYEVMATVNGSSATLAPFSATSIGGYYLAVGEYDIGEPRSQTECSYGAPAAFMAAAVKAP